MNENDNILMPLGVAAAGVTFLGLIARYGGSEIVAAWVQAIGTVGAVIAATVIASKQSRAAAAATARDRAALEAREQKAAYFLLMRLASVLGDIEIKLVNNAKAVAQLPHNGTLITQDIDSVLDAILFHVSWDEQIFARFDLLPTVGAHAVSHLLYSVARFDRQTTKLMRFTAKHGGSWNEIVEKLQSNFENMRKDLNIAKAALKPVLDNPPPDAVKA
jgi:hypothetical protein